MQTILKDVTQCGKQEHKYCGHLIHIIVFASYAKINKFTLTLGEISAKVYNKAKLGISKGSNFNRTVYRKRTILDP